LNGSDLAPPLVFSALRTRRFGRAYEFLPSCGSTNDEVARLAAHGADEGFLLASDAQTRGRGRRGRLWHSSVGENLCFSLLLRPAIAPTSASPLTLLAGAALGRALVSLGFSPQLKWPNDVMLDTGHGLRKVAGILTEMASEGSRIRHIVLGVGVNVNGQRFPDHLAPLATSLRLARDAPIAMSRGALLAAFINAFEPIYDDFITRGPAAGLAEWRRLALLGQPCWVERESARVDGVAEDVDASGALLIRSSDGKLICVYSGQVNWPGSR
jgi:BirA family biotin operon repressor/biotin-[acetyl-CoA-carboxylase] ligase